MNYILIVVSQTFNPKDYRLELKPIAVPSSAFAAVSISLVGPREWDYMEAEECDWVVDTFTSVISSYLWGLTIKQTTVWGCVPKSRQYFAPLDIIGQIFRWFSPKTWRISDKGEVEDIIRRSCTHFEPTIFVGVDSGAGKPIARRILNSCYLAKDPKVAITELAGSPLRFIVAPMIEAVEAELFLDVDQYDHLSKTLTGPFEVPVVTVQE